MRNPIRVQEVTALAGKDLSRWQQNKQGDWVRILGGGGEQGVKATAGAVELAYEHGIDLATLTGSGKDGNITKADVEAALA